MIEDHVFRTCQIISQEASVVSAELCRPSVLYRPALKKTDWGWTAEYGELIVSSCSAAGAMEAFDKQWLEEK